MKFRIFLAAAVLFLFTAASFSAETVHLTLTGSTQGWIKGDSTKTTLGRDNTIECFTYNHMVVSLLDDEGQPSGKNNHYPITILKKIDKSSPRLFRALRNRESCTAVFKFFRPNPIGDGTTQQYYTVTLTGVYISGIRQESPSTLDPTSALLSPVERVSFTYGEIAETWTPSPDTYEYGGRWECERTNIPFSDINFDGVVNMKDYAIMADDWLTQY